MEKRSWVDGQYLWIDGYYQWVPGYWTWRVARQQAVYDYWDCPTCYY